MGEMNGVDVQDDLGYSVKKYNFPTKRYYQTLDLKQDAYLIEMYKERHSEKYYWKEVGEGIRNVGILEMDIYQYKERLIMVVETALDFDWDMAFQQLAEMPIQIEWEKYMSIFQNADSLASSAEKWQKMERIFCLP